MSWRVGTKNPLNVYDGERSVCQCHNEDDAQKIVIAMNLQEAALPLVLDLTLRP